MKKIKTMREAVSNSFWAGMLVMIGVRSLIQDIRGHEAIIKSVQNDWVDARYTVPLALAMLEASMVLYVGATNNADKHDSKTFVERP